MHSVHYVLRNEILKKDHGETHYILVDFCIYFCVLIVNDCFDCKIEISVGQCIYYTRKILKYLINFSLSLKYFRL